MNVIREGKNQYRIFDEERQEIEGKRKDVELDWKGALYNFLH